MVHELRCDPSTNSRIQVEAVRLNYEKRGLPWHWKFSPTIGQIEPEVFAHWVDRLDSKEFAYALTPIRDWTISGIKLGKALKARGDTYTSTTNGHVDDNPLKAPVGELSPGKRPHSEVSWDTEDEEIPSNSPPPGVADILRLEQQRIIGLRGMTEEELLTQVLEQSMEDVGGDTQMKSHMRAKQTRPVPVVPEVDEEQPEDSMTIQEIDELMERSFDWGLSMSCDPNLGPFPKKEVADEIKSKRPQRHASLAKTNPRLKVQPSLQIPHPFIETSPPKADIAAGGLDGVEEQSPLLTSLLSGSFPESFERGSKSRFTPSDTAGSAKDNRMKVDYIVDAVSHAHEIIPSAESRYNPYKEIVAKAARDNGLIDMGIYQRISNKNRGRGKSSTQNDRSRRQAEENAEAVWQKLHRPLSPPAESIGIADQRHAAENEPYFKDVHYVLGPLLSKATTIGKEKSEASENVVVVHIEEVGEDDNDENPPSQQRPPTQHDIALRTLTINKQTWLKEDEEYKRITTSRQSLSEHLAQDDIPLSRRSTAMVSAVIRDQEQREAWILKKAGLKARISLTLLSASAPDFVSAAPAAAPAAAGAPSPPSSPSSDDSMSSIASASSYASAQEGDAEVGIVARGLTLAATVSPGPFLSAVAAGNARVVDVETEPFPELEQLDKTVMPVADMQFGGRGTSSSNSASTNGVVSLSHGGLSVLPVIHGGGASSPVHDGDGSRSHGNSQRTEVRLRNAVSEGRRSLAEVGVIPESPDKSGGDEKMPDVEMVELSPENIAKEA